MADTKARSTNWSLTINNPTDADREQMDRARQKGWKIIGQTEMGGENGTVHYQCMLITPQVRFSAVKKTFTRAHIEAARNVSALLNYVHKEETRVDDLPSSDERYPTLNKYWDLVYQYCIDSGYLDLAFPNHPRWYRPKFHMTELELLDEATTQLIRDGYYCESLCVNPQVRSSFQKFSLAIFRRAHVDRQTDRQHQARLDEQNVIVPTVHNNDADDDTHPERVEEASGLCSSREAATCEDAEVSEASSHEGSDCGH